MAVSPAEERIRAKVVAAMRRRWPSARIVHELVLEQSVIRIDVAAIGEDFLAVAEIKSEKDVLKRLASQAARAVEVADETWIVLAAKHEAAVDGLRWSVDDRQAAKAIRGARVLVERDPASDDLEPSVYDRAPRPHTPDPRQRFDLLWAGEMRSALGRHFGGATISTGKLTRDQMTSLAVEHMTGRELRRAVCVQLRERSFPRADDPASLSEIKPSGLYRKAEPTPAAAVDQAFGDEA